jgi:hypothetical protein
MYETADKREEALKEYKAAADLGGTNYQIGKLAAQAGQSLESQSQPVRLASTSSAPGGRSPSVFRPSTSTAPATLPAGGPTSGPAAGTAPAGEPATAPAPASRSVATQP